MFDEFPKKLTIAPHAHKEHTNITDRCCLGADDHHVAHNINAQRPYYENGSVVRPIGNERVSKGTDKAKDIHWRRDKQCNDLSEAEGFHDALYTIHQQGFSDKKLLEGLTGKKYVQVWEVSWQICIKTNTHTLGSVTASHKPCLMDPFSSTSLFVATARRHSAKRCSCSVNHFRWPERGKSGSKTTASIPATIVPAPSIMNNHLTKNGELMEPRPPMICLSLPPSC
ncbi:unnamed protein product [Aspergillus oryzae]|uniref:Unnamed protein product n=1 Tax=Aspergillus oryzae TaxID=5062 RepID=A0AAN5BWZ1_ASPOZ|nr:unnamed protein product [Aspergillus oryzae]